MDYYVNTQPQPNGDHEVHTNSCHRLPSEQNRRYFGNFSWCGPAVEAAKKIYPKADGCVHCSKECHTS